MWLLRANVAAKEQPEYPQPWAGCSSEQGGVRRGKGWVGGRLQRAKGGEEKWGREVDRGDLKGRRGWGEDRWRGKHSV